jgi:hypothetical protein
MPYSVLTALLAGPGRTMAPLVALQAVLTGLTVAVALGAAANGAGAAEERTRGLLAVLILAVATPAAWVTSFAMPDVFAAITILVIATLSFAADRLTPPVAAALSLIGALAIAAHASHVALAILLAPLGLAWGAWTQWRARGRVSLSGLAWLAAPAALGLAVVIAASLAGFGKVSLAPKRYPLTLARSIEDGPARWYLERHCATSRYAVCEIYGVRLPTTSTAFLWGPDGVSARATAAQMDRIRAEEQDIVLRAAVAYPVAQLSAAARGVARQLVSFRVGEANFDVRVVRDAAGAPVFANAPVMPAGLEDVVDTLSKVTAGLALVWIALGVRAAPPERRALALFVVVGVLANAAVCAVFSSVSDRYQARVVWLLPIAAAMLPAPFRRRLPKPDLADPAGG